MKRRAPCAKLKLWNTEVKSIGLSIRSAFFPGNPAMHYVLVVLLKGGFCFTMEVTKGSGQTPGAGYLLQAYTDGLCVSVKHQKKIPPIVKGYGRICRHVQFGDLLKCARSWLADHGSYELLRCNCQAFVQHLWLALTGKTLPIQGRQCPASVGKHCPASRGGSAALITGR